MGTEALLNLPGKASSPFSTERGGHKSFSTITTSKDHLPLGKQWKCPEGPLDRERKIPNPLRWTSGNGGSIGSGHSTRWGARPTGVFASLQKVLEQSPANKTRVAVKQGPCQAGVSQYPPVPRLLPLQGRPGFEWNSIA